MECHVTARAGQFALDVALSAQAELSWLGITGHSGAGKSTLLQALAGFETTARVSGKWQNINLENAENTVLVSAQTPLFPALSVAKNIELVARHNQQHANVDTIVALCECEALLTRHTNELSGGELQRVKLARALLAKPALLLLDESFSAMDRALRFRILKKLKAYIGQRTKVIMVSHEINDIILCCDHLGVIEKGHCVASGTLQEMLNPVSFAGAGTLLPLISVLHGVIRGSKRGISRVMIGQSELSVAGEYESQTDHAVRVLVPAKEVLLTTEQTGVIKTNRLHGVVRTIQPYSAMQSTVSIDCEGQTLMALVDNYDVRLDSLHEGQWVWAYFSGQQTLA